MFYGFDCLSLGGRDLRSLPLIERMEILERLVTGHPRTLYAGHVERDGSALFKLVCEQISKALWPSAETAPTARTLNFKVRRLRTSLR